MSGLLREAYTLTVSDRACEAGSLVHRLVVAIRKLPLKMAVYTATLSLRQCINNNSE